MTQSSYILQAVGHLATASCGFLWRVLQSAPVFWERETFVPRSPGVHLLPSRSECVLSFLLLPRLGGFGQTG
ncbi:uncharacterized protein LAJ45_09581 [Morchella importuna]|uniref:uncharacterized protein n=1 Tax=Morchella importuna TaxID=1174673 RepID=UPI001E8D1FCE|nr:uncharacterized protein LAJ45_09581 [Morchella importuna]KAH8146388.1 hypothetical protein LAJ45_09581 [Morchella importuna]